MDKQPKEPKPPKPPKGDGPDVRWCHHCAANRVGTVQQVTCQHIVGDQAREFEMPAWVCGTCSQPRLPEAGD